MASRRTLLSRLRSLFGRRTWVPPGHPYSPIPAPRDLTAALWAASPPELPGLDLGVAHQLEVLRALEALQSDQAYRGPAPAGGWRYRGDNDMFGPGSASTLHLMLRHLRPRRVVEVGSGFSSAVMLDTDEHWLGSATEFTFIDPDPRRLELLLKPGDRSRARVLPERVQDVASERFNALEAGDLLFVDSSHVLKTGGDVGDLLFRVLPALRPGVVVHFHDVLYPFEYPRPWVQEGRAWNEAYALRAFLLFNREFAIVFWASYLYQHHREALSRVESICGNGSSLWIERCGRNPLPAPARPGV